MNREGASFAVLNHQDMVDIGFVSAKDVTKFLAEKYIPDLEIKGTGGMLIQIKNNNLQSST